MVSAAAVDNILDDVPGAPSESYFWRRKRDLCLRLLQRHCEFAAPAAQPAPRVFVDLGCGWATDLWFFVGALDAFAATGAPSHTWRLIGIDGDFEKLALAEARLARTANPVELIRADFTARIPLPDHSADLICCSEVIEHLLDPAPLIREWRRVLRPGGMVLVTTPNEPNLFQRSFYSDARRQANREELLATPHVVSDEHGRTFSVHGHVGIHTVREWESIFAAQGLERVGFERGAMFYGSPFHNRPLVFAAQRTGEFLLDLLPASLTRTISDQLIGLYRVR